VGLNLSVQVSHEDGGVLEVQVSGRFELTKRRQDAGGRGLAVERHRDQVGHPKLSPPGQTGRSTVTQMPGPRSAAFDQSTAHGRSARDAR
jgi:hypothetical protein